MILELVIFICLHLNRQDFYSWHLTPEETLQSMLFCTHIQGQLGIPIQARIYFSLLYLRVWFWLPALAEILVFSVRIMSHNGKSCVSFISVSDYVAVTSLGSNEPTTYVICYHVAHLPLKMNGHGVIIQLV